MDKMAPENVATSGTVKMQEEKLGERNFTYGANPLTWKKS